MCSASPEWSVDLRRDFEWEAFACVTLSRTREGDAEAEVICSSSSSQVQLASDEKLRYRSAAKSPTSSSWWFHQHSPSSFGCICILNSSWQLASWICNDKASEDTRRETWERVHFLFYWEKDRRVSTAPQRVLKSSSTRLLLSFQLFLDSSDSDEEGQTSTRVNRFRDKRLQSSMDTIWKQPFISLSFELCMFMQIN